MSYSNFYLILCDLFHAYSEVSLTSMRIGKFPTFHSFMGSALRVFHSSWIPGRRMSKIDARMEACAVCCSVFFLQLCCTYSWMLHQDSFLAIITIVSSRYCSCFCSLVKCHASLPIYSQLSQLRVMFCIMHICIWIVAQFKVHTLSSTKFRLLKGTPNYLTKYHGVYSCSLLGRKKLVHLTHSVPRRWEGWAAWITHIT